MQNYTIEIAGKTRHLPIIPINDEISIASFSILGDREIVEAAALALAKKLPDVDVFITAEAKGIPLVYELARIFNHARYIVARKDVKAYMHTPFIHEVDSITTTEKQILALDYVDAAFMKYKRVAIIDDVVSTGSSLNALEELVQLAGGNVIVKACILAEGDAIGREDLTYLEDLPLFPNK